MRAVVPILLLTALLPAQEPDSLPNDQRTNGCETLSPLSVMQGVNTRSVVQIVDERGHCVLLGVVLSADGYVITKASELPFAEHVTLAWADGTQANATPVLTDRGLDLTLLHTDNANGLPMEINLTAQPALGDWLAAFTTVDEVKRELRLGNVSATTRAVPSRGAALGVELHDVPGREGVSIDAVAIDSPAARADLRKADQLLRVDDLTVHDKTSVHEALSHRQPGEEVQLYVRRGDQEVTVPLRLASRAKVIANWDGEDYANGGVSLRTDGYAQVIQHAMPLAPTDMGGPLLDLNGKMIGLNIARVDRVSTFALPVKTFWNQVQLWIAADRKAQRAE
jgi:serine protease Do